MTLVNTRAAFEKAVTDAVSDVDPTVQIRHKVHLKIITLVLFNAMFMFQKVKVVQFYLR